MEAIYYLLLGRDVRFSLGDLWLQASRVELREKLTLLHMVAFLSQHHRHALTRIERQIDLAQVDIAIQH